MAARRSRARKAAAQPRNAGKTGSHRREAPAATPPLAEAGTTRRLHAIVLFMLAVGLYANTLGHDYVLDDAVVITRNELTRQGLAGIPKLLTSGSFRGYLGSEADEVVGGRYRPLSLVSFAVEVAIFGVNPFVSHAVNVVLYGLLCVVLYWVLLTLLGERGPPSLWRHLSLPFAAALLFTVHPLHTEVVANVKGRDELLALLLSLASLGLALRAREQAGRGPVLALAAVFFLALLAKENAITFLAVVPLSLWFFARDFRADLARTLPALAAAALAYLALRQSIVVSAPSVPELLNDPFLEATQAEAWATVFTTLGLYLKLLVWPHPLTHDYAPYHIALGGWDELRPWLGLGLQLALAGLALAGLRRRWIPAYAAAAYLATLSVVSNLFFPIGTFMSERFLFMPSVFACLGLAWALLAALERGVPDPRRRAAVAIALGLAVASVFGSLTLRRNPVWKDGETLFTTDARTSSRSALVNANAADVLTIRARASSDPAERERLTRAALAHLEAAVEVHPRYERALAMLATTWKDLAGDPERALGVYERLFEIAPRRRHLAYDLGSLTLLHRPERTAEAARYLERAIELAPDDADAHANLGVARYRSGDLDGAIESLERAVALAPEHPGHRANLAELLAEAGEPGSR